MAQGIGAGIEWIRTERPRNAALRRRLSEYTAPLVLGLALAALFLVALRVDILRMRYQLTDAQRIELDLTKQKATLAARYWGLRDPMRLSDYARKAGFIAPACVIELEGSSNQQIGCGE